MGLVSAICSVALVLLMDVSGSVGAPEYELQRDGTAAAFDSTEVLSAVRQSDGIAVAVVEFADTVTTVVRWRILRTEDDSRQLANSIRALERSEGSSTATGNALLHALNLLREPPCEPESRMIDITTDGESNLGTHPNVARARAVAERVRINALGIRTGTHQNPTLWLSEHVITPAMEATDSEPYIRAGFAVEITDWDQFATAIRRKIVFELAGLSWQNAVE